MSWIAVLAWLREIKPQVGRGKGASPVDCERVLSMSSPSIGGEWKAAGESFLIEHHQAAGRFRVTCAHGVKQSTKSDSTTGGYSQSREQKQDEVFARSQLPTDQMLSVSLAWRNSPMNLQLGCTKCHANINVLTIGQCPEEQFRSLLLHGLILEVFLCHGFDVDEHTCIMVLQAQEARSL
ncbi:hypothetical protein BO94DRAFT_551179 [Aspergillus sclerotioniger CBS 115572]|uniref:Uncharacterized protein n=1 Tax=Aspergillus sclerotioniger CBS 115572 TaxID=1450535 RepID=A0A317V577_9EURO|nr:hypothetical protein BO94DRAFT_551179 [Aspergillus sclerotioniger CBS 115572]PWY68002.1 hypothetical protein BO94DRAFT_551179 [Aspergillus sclerotioniger CBS 115572]